ncbi:MAG TPA: hypothetical protein VGV64_05155 [Thermoplasmata archaeon]|nr:hypothetical protein [Thermoplasmata archaeon]
MRSARTQEPADRFLGVRLTREELERLDRFGVSNGSRSRSESVRALVRASEHPATQRTDLPIGLEGQLETVVEDGWARSFEAALSLVVTLGLQELSRIHGERLPGLRERAREGASRRRTRQAADRSGQGLLDR